MISLLLLFLIGPARAETDVLSSYQQAKEQLSTDDNVHRQVLGTLYLINKKMKVMSQKRSSLTDRMLATRGDVQRLARKMVALENKLNGQRQILARRLAALYRLNTQATLRVIFSSTSTAELDRNMKFLKIISDRDYNVIKDYQADLLELAQQRERLKIQVQHLARIQSELKNQEGLLAGEQKSKSKLLDQLSVDQKRALDRLKALKSQDARLLETAFFERKGALPSPITAKLAQEYSILEDPELRFRLSHKGLFFRAEGGTPVRSVHRGQVRFAGWVPGYGHTILIDHGDHYYTLYASTSAVQVEVGQSVTEGQVLGESGTSDLHKDRGLYFEIRHFSDAIDPAAWIKDNQNKRVSLLEGATS